MRSSAETYEALFLITNINYQYYFYISDIPNLLPRKKTKHLKPLNNSSKSEPNQKQSSCLQRMNTIESRSFQITGLTQKETNLSSEDNFSRKISTNNSNYLTPPIMSYASRSKEISKECQKLEENINLKSLYDIHVERNMQGERNNLTLKESVDHFDVQSIINERRPLKLKVNPT